MAHYDDLFDEINEEREELRTLDKKIQSLPRGCSEQKDLIEKALRIWYSYDRHGHAHIIDVISYRKILRNEPEIDNSPEPYMGNAY